MYRQFCWCAGLCSPQPPLFDEKQSSLLEWLQHQNEIQFSIHQLACNSWHSQHEGPSLHRGIATTACIIACAIKIGHACKVVTISCALIHIPTSVPPPGFLTYTLLNQSGLAIWRNQRALQFLKRLLVLKRLSRKQIQQMVHNPHHNGLATASLTVLRPHCISEQLASV